MEKASTTAEFQYPRRRVLRGIMRKLIAVAFNKLCDFNIVGRENVPMHGPLLVISNHFSFLDPVAAIHVIPRQLEFVGGSQLPNAPAVVRWIPSLWGTYKVHRGSVSREALNAGEQVLANGGALGAFPEAGNWAEVLRPARPGIALLAARSGAAVLPLGLDGLTDVFPFFRKGRRAHVTVRIGKPFGPFRGLIKGRADRHKLDEISNEMMQRIAELIPPERRGFFSDDPRVREAAKGSEIYPWANIAER